MASIGYSRVEFDGSNTGCGAPRTVAATAPATNSGLQPLGADVRNKTPNPIDIVYNARRTKVSIVLVSGCFQMNFSTVSFSL